MTDGAVEFHLESVQCRRGSRIVLDGISIDIPASQITGVIGPSGTGKSTFLRLLNRFEVPSSGRISFRGDDLDRLDPVELRRTVGLLTQKPVMLADTLVGEVRVAAPGLADEQVEELLGWVDLQDLGRSRSPQRLSGGEQQRLALARALALEPQVLLLDEPTSALDEVAAAVTATVLRQYRQRGGTVVVVSHDLRLVASLSDQVLVLGDARIQQFGPPAAIRQLEVGPR